MGETNYDTNEKPLNNAGELSKYINIIARKNVFCQDLKNYTSYSLSVIPIATPKLFEVKKNAVSLNTTPFSSDAISVLISSGGITAGIKLFYSLVVPQKGQGLPDIISPQFLQRHLC